MEDQSIKIKLCQRAQALLLKQQAEQAQQPEDEKDAGIC